MNAVAVRAIDALETVKMSAEILVDELEPERPEYQSIDKVPYRPLVNFSRHGGRGHSSGNEKS